MAPENTLAAFKRAIDDGADGIELDVRLSSDNIPVVIHDATLRRTGCSPEAIANLTARQLAETEVGRWFNHAHPSLACEEFKHERVSTLERVFQLVKDRAPARFKIYVELKAEGPEADQARPVIDLIKRFRFQNRVVIVSFDFNSLRQVKLIDSTIRAGALFAPRNGLRAERVLKMAEATGAEEILLHRLIARPRLVKSSQERGWAVVVWTVDDATWRKRAAELGVHALITNNPTNFRVARASRP